MSTAAASPAAPVTVAAPEGDLRQPSRWLVTAICVGAFVGMVDATIVAVALQPLAVRFAVPLTAAQEVLGVYLIVVVAAMPTVGRLGDRLGRRSIYISGFVVFAVGSAAAALAPTFVALLIARAVQALGGGMLNASSLALITEYVPRRRAGRSVAILVVVQAVAGLIGPPLGGLLTALGGWQAVFWAGLPLAGAGILLGLRHIPAGSARREVRFDLPGALLVVAVLLGLSGGIASLGGPVVGDLPAIVWFSISWIALLLLVPFEIIARRPIIDGRLLRQSRFSAATVATFLSTGTLMSCFALLPFWLESTHGASPTLAGLAFLPIALGIGGSSRWGGALGDRGRTRVATGAGMSLAAGGLLVCALAAGLRAWPLLVFGLLILGVGNGLFSAPNTAAAMSLAPRAILGAAAATLGTARNSGVIVGLSVTGAIDTALAQSSGGDAAARAVFIGAAVVCALVALLAVRTYR
ncbi:MAG: MFS transporter [Candidatus Dormibacteria bacterium]